MEMEQQLEWAKAQKIRVSVDLVAAAKQQLKFLAAIDRKRWLYDGPALERAINRYNACWLPLLAKYSGSQIMKAPLVVPLDCEWVWHCHKLNPVQYKSDCVELYGRILDNHNVVSSTGGTSSKDSEQIWNEMFPHMPYDFEFTGAFSEKDLGEGKYTKYDLQSAVKRQSSFFYQVSRAHMSNNLFLEEAVARYKGFLHLIWRNKEKSLKRFCVPTYDVDLIWHSHQLHPTAYCRDLIALLGKVLEHDDTDSDRSKGMKLDTGFSDTTNQWEDTFGSRYWKAGAMYRGNAPSPVTSIAFAPKFVAKLADIPKETQKLLSLPEIKTVEVMLECVGVRNLPEGHKGSLYVIFSKTQPDTIFNVKRRLSILSESGEKQVASFHCEPNGSILFELISHSPSNLKIVNRPTTLGSASISFDNLMDPLSSLSLEKWLELDTGTCTAGSKPIGLRVAMSFTIPTAAPHVLHTVPSRPFSKGSCFFVLPRRVQSSKSWTRVIDEAGNEVISLQMREIKKGKGEDDSIRKKEVIGVTNLGNVQTLGASVGTEWSFNDSQWSLQLRRTSNEDGHIFELMGPKIVKLYPGRRLEYEPKHCEKHKSELDSLTIVEFSPENPYGRALALLDMKSGFFTVKEEWLVLPALILNFILSDIGRKEGYKVLTDTMRYFPEMDGKEADVGLGEGGERTRLTVEKDVTGETEAISVKAVAVEKVMGGCGGTGVCGAGCGNGLKSDGYSLGNGGVGYGNALNSGGDCGGCGAGGCGAGGCGGGCGNRVESSGCGGSCGGAYGNSARCGSCGGGGCGSGCGNSAKSGGCSGRVESSSCSSGCGGGCGNSAKSGSCGGGCSGKSY